MPCLKHCRVPFMSTLRLSTNHCQYTLCCILTAAFHKQTNTADLSTGGMKRMVTSKYHSVNVLVSRPSLGVLLKKSLSLSRSISSSGRRCPDVTAKLFPVLCHSACRCHRTERIRDVFLPSLSWLSSASFPGYHSLHYCLL